ncbi:hypothetical protein M5K25_002299 [Dendrobium thyrsiflorum]|uniref:Uncharacterized protein n=1 Tax=Dendrobium thyrsiflorum TaxID=117978 RepID=A0ABD0W7Q9_DENTH
MPEKEKKRRHRDGLEVKGGKRFSSSAAGAAATASKEAKRRVMRSDSTVDASVPQIFWHTASGGASMGALGARAPTGL